jgi:transposase InsO family protein
MRGDEEALRGDVVKLASRYGRYGYRRVTALLQAEGWAVNHKRVERIWRQEGLRVPKKQPKRGRLWLNDGSCIRLRPTHQGSVWSYDFTVTRTHNGRAVRMLTVLDEYTRECLAIVVARKLKSDDVLHTLAELFALRGAPEHLRSDNGPEFTAKVVREWLKRVGVQTLFIAPGSPWENGYNESFNGKLKDELIHREIFTYCGRPRSSWSSGAGSTIRSGRTVRWAIGHPRRRRFGLLECGSDGPHFSGQVRPGGWRPD